MTFLSRFLFALICLIWAACSQAPEGPAPLVVGMELAYPPFEMTDQEGNPTGVSVDLASAIAESLGRPLEIRNMSFDGLIPALKTGSIDLIISSMTANEERAKSIDFSDPYVNTELSLLTGKASGVTSVTDLNDPSRTVVVKLGTTGHLYAKAHLPRTTLRVLEKENACVIEVVQGKADAFIFDQMSIYQHGKRHPDTTKALFDSFQREFWAIGIQKGNEDLKTQVNLSLAAFREAGGFEQLGERYLGEVQAAFRELDVPFVFDIPDTGE